MMWIYIVYAEVPIKTVPIFPFAFAFDFDNVVSNICFLY